jgi:hypothetical protein
MIYIPEPAVNERRLESLGSFIGATNALLAIYALVVAILWFIKGNDWLQYRVLPLHAAAYGVLLGFSLLVLIPMMVVRGARPYAGFVLFGVSHGLGAITWFYTAHYCRTVLDLFWLLAGILMGGVGVVPIAIIGAMTKGNWENFWFFLAQTLIALALYALAKRAAAADTA